jgi:NADH-quinone oxidoreductase subunit N
MFNDLMLLYVALELLSLCFVVKVFVLKNEIVTSMTGLKYFVMNVVMSIMLLLGCSLLYGSCGSTNILDMEIFYFTDPTALNSLLGFKGIIGLMLVLSALLFKLAAVPFHL